MIKPLRLSEYPTPEYMVEGEPFPLDKIKRLRKLFPKESSLKLTYGFPDEECCDLEIEYQVKKGGRWRHIGYAQGMMTFKWLPANSASEFISWVHDLYHDEVDIEGSEVDKLWEECFT